jgi:hypothetical protein
VKAAVVAAHLVAALVALQLAGPEASIFALAVALGGVGVAHPAGLAALRRMETT